MEFCLAENNFPSEWVVIENQFRAFLFDNLTRGPQVYAHRHYFIRSGGFTSITK